MIKISHDPAMHFWPAANVGAAQTVRMYLKMPVF